MPEARVEKARANLGEAASKGLRERARELRRELGSALRSGDLGLHKERSAGQRREGEAARLAANHRRGEVEGCGCTSA